MFKEDGDIYCAIAYQGKYFHVEQCLLTRIWWYFSRSISSERIIPVFQCKCSTLHCKEGIHGSSRFNTVYAAQQEL